LYLRFGSIVIHNNKHLTISPLFRKSITLLC